MSLSFDRGTTIGRLRLRAAAADPDALRRRGAAALGALDLGPPALPEQTILCIRRLDDPLPGALDLRFHASPRPSAWEAAMRGAVGEALRRAVRPALASVPADAAAVLFADRAELLECAARDALHGDLAAHWWWTHLLADRSPAAVVREWTRAPAYVPAALELLAARGESAAFARAMEPGVAVRLLDAVLRTHALPALAVAVARALTAPASLRLLPASATLPETSAPPVGSATPRVARRPWHAVAPEVARSALPVEQECFVALALLLRRAPSLVRSARFAPETVAWIESERLPQRRPAEPAAAREVEAPAPSATAPTGSCRDEREPIGRPNVSPVAPPGARVREPPRRRPRPHRQVGPPERTVSFAPAPGAERPATVHASRPLPARPEAPVPSTPAPASAAPVEPPAVLSEPPRPDLEIDSGFAGVFFLLNVAIALGLYGDFTSPVQTGIELDVWDFLALAGDALAGTVDFAGDPLGPLLATLAKRQDGEAPGARFVPPDGETLAAWLAATVAALAERLAAAGIAEPSRVVRRYGRIATTPAHLDVRFALAAHPIEFRLAGLDRNPGFIPAAGRHVAFQFD